MFKKILPDALNHILKGSDVIGKGTLSIFCYRISRIGLSANKPFVYLDIAVFLKAYQVCGKVSISYFQHLLQVIKAHFIIYHKHAHHTQPDAVIKYFI